MTRVEKVSLAVMIVCLAVTAVLTAPPMIGVSDATSGVVTVLAGFVFTILHGRLAIGATRLAVFVAIAVMVSFTLEAIGVATGWIFGNYYYSDSLGPKLLGVPLATQAAYVSMCYASLNTARVILGVFGTPKGWGNIGVAFSSTFIMVNWDVALDPYQSTVFGHWVWPDGGAYFGVPMHNYAGWFGTVFTLMLLYMIYERRNPLPAPSGIARTRWFWAQPVIFYGLIAVGIIIAPLVGGLPDPIAAPEHYTGPITTLQYSLTLVAMFVMGTPVVLALTRLMVKE
jgi:putative membrane protein